jgi:hypothetical protein
MECSSWRLKVPGLTRTHRNLAIVSYSLPFALPRKRIAYQTLAEQSPYMKSPSAKLRPPSKTTVLLSGNLPQISCVALKIQNGCDTSLAQEAVAKRSWGLLKGVLDPEEASASWTAKELGGGSVSDLLCYVLKHCFCILLFADAGRRIPLDYMDRWLIFVHTHTCSHIMIYIYRYIIYTNISIQIYTDT